MGVVGRSDNCIWSDLLVKMFPDDAAPKTDMGWPIASCGFRDVLLWIHRRYTPSGGIYVTENGMGSRETLMKHDSLNDSDRIHYFHAYISAIKVDDGG